MLNARTTRRKKIGSALLWPLNCLPHTGIQIIQRSIFKQMYAQPAVEYQPGVRTQFDYRAKLQRIPLAQDIS
jgi:hypothetical protein